MNTDKKSVAYNSGWFSPVMERTVPLDRRADLDNLIRIPLDRRADLDNLIRILKVNFPCQTESTQILPTAK